MQALSSRANFALLILLLLSTLMVGCRSASMGGDRSLGGTWELDFEGNDSIGDSALSDVIVDVMNDFDQTDTYRSVLDDAAYTIENHYRSKGWSQAQASYDLDESKVDTLLATISIEEGPRCMLTDIHFDGVADSRSQEILELLSPTESTLFGNPDWFVQSEAESKVAAITTFYLELGYLLVRVDDPRVSFNEEQTTAKLRYNIDEGPRFQIAELNFANNSPLTELELLDSLPVQVGDPYSPAADRRIQSTLIELLGERGYRDAKVVVRRRADDESGDVTLQVIVTSGQYIVVDEIRVEGNERTETELILARLDAPLGEPLTPSRERKSFRRLFTSGLFSSIKLNFDGDPQQTERLLVVKVEENPSREVFIEPGWGSYELGRIKAGYRDQNIFGTGRSFRAESVASFRHLEFELGVSDPYLFGSEVFGDVSATTLRRIEPSFTRISNGVDASLTRKIEKESEAGFGYQFRRSAAEDVDITDPAALAALDNLSISAIELSLRYDTRDNPLVPTRGSTARFSTQWGDKLLGSELDFLRVRGQLTHFLSMHDAGTIGFTVRSGAIIPTHDTEEIPLQERYFNGGGGSVRSFRENQLGPLDATGEALGGEAFTVLSAEWRRALSGNMSSALFFDMGNVAPNYEDYFEFNDFRAAIGIGIRYMLPIGPLRLDGGWNPNPRDDDEDFVLHFSVGMPF
ncbi:MAG: outer membrane protein insertion porin family [Planctomycetota bacterium]|jgi:outer membrane protein insertion porin family